MRTNIELCWRDIALHSWSIILLSSFGLNQLQSTSRIPLKSKYAWVKESKVQDWIFSLKFRKFLSTKFLKWLPLVVEPFEVWLPLIVEPKAVWLPLVVEPFEVWLPLVVEPQAVSGGNRKGFPELLFLPPLEQKEFLGCYLIHTLDGKKLHKIL